MLDTATQRATAHGELKRSHDLPPYEAADVTWLAVIKLANLLPGDSEYKRLIALLDSLPSERIQTILSHQAVDTLLNLAPPLESVLNMPHERLDKTRTAQEMGIIRKCRNAEPKCALKNLVKILKRVRNRRAHGFKTPNGSRDQQILSSVASLLRAIGEAAIDVIET
jgi:hypothetical protein